MQLTRPIILSYVQAESILKSKEQGKSSVHVSPDLGLSMVMAELSPDGVVFPNDEQLDWRSIEKISTSEVNCFILEEGAARPIQVFWTRLRVWDIRLSRWPGLLMKLLR